jgi:hypothetical protein
MDGVRLSRGGGGDVEEGWCREVEFVILVLVRELLFLRGGEMWRISCGCLFEPGVVEGGWKGPWELDFI